MANATGFLRVYNGLTIKLSSNTPSGQGDIVSDSGTGNLLYHNGTTSAAIGTASNTLTLSNKSIDAGSNTLTGIVNSCIAAGAAIAYSKLNLAGSIVNADIATGAAIAYSKLSLGTSIVNSDISASAAIAYSKLSLAGSIVNADIASGAAIAHSKMAALSVSKIAATDASGFVTTTNGVVPVTAKGDLIVGSAASTASVLSVGADGTMPVADSSQTTGIRWATQTQGSKNYITYNNFENAATTGWSLANVGTLTNGLPTGTTPNFASATGNIVISAVSSGKLAGTNSLQAQSTAANTAGDGFCSSAYTIDIEDQAKCLGIKFSYKVSSGATNGNFSGTSSNSFAVAIWDTANTAFIPVNGAFNIVQSTGVGTFTGTFQTASNSTSIRLVVYQPNASAGAITMLYDSFFVGPQITSMGPAMDDWVAYTPTFTGFGTVGATNVFSRRNGDSLEITGYFTSGTPTATPGLMTLGYRGANANVTAAGSDKFATYTPVGIGGWNVTGASIPMWLGVNNSNTLTLTAQDGSHATTAVANANTFVASGQSFSFFLRIPILGWSSNAVQSADTDNRQIFTEVALAAASVTPGTNGAVKFDTILKDTSGSYSTSTGVYTCPVTGPYRVVCALAIATAASCDPYLSKNGSAYKYFFAATVNGAIGTGVLELWCNAGDTLSINMNTGSAVNGGSAPYLTSASFSRMSGPAVVQATESVNGRYTGASATLSGSFSTVTYSTKDFDTHGAYSGSTLTIPVSGKYEICASLIMGGTWAANSTYQLSIYKNGSEVTQTLIYAGGAVTNQSGEVFDIISCLAGDLITIRAAASASSPNVNNAVTTRNVLCWARLGN